MWVQLRTDGTVDPESLPEPYRTATVQRIRAMDAFLAQHRDELGDTWIWRDLIFADIPLQQRVSTRTIRAILSVWPRTVACYAHTGQDRFDYEDAHRMTRHALHGLLMDPRTHAIHGPAFIGFLAWKRGNVTIRLDRDGDLGDDENMNEKSRRKRKQR